MPMNYQQLLRNPLWQRKRLEIFTRDNWKCTKCHDQFTNLQVHHNFYDDRLPWEYPDESLITVCELCHQKEEFYKWLNLFIKALRKDNFEGNEIELLKEIIKKRVADNNHAESVLNYINDVKKLIHA